MVSIFRKISFFRRQILLSVGTNLISIFVLVILLYRAFYTNYKEELIDSINTQVSLISSTVSSALVFDDEYAATEILREVYEHPDYLYVQLYSKDKVLFAEQKKDRASKTLGLNEVSEGPEEKDGLIFHRKTVYFDSEVVGYIVLCASTESFQEKKSQLQWLLLSTAVFTSILVFFISIRPQRELGKPIKELINLVKYVKDNQKYDRRICIDRRDDIGELVGGVNQMLDTIEDQRKKAETHTEELESLVDLRTKQLFERANYDSLTRLPNRHLLVEYLEKAIARADKRGDSAAVLFLDLNRFKVINDSLGHAVGDKLLKIVAYKLCYALRKIDCVSRWGGDEFVVVVQDVISRDKVELLCEKIIETVGEPCVIDNHQLHVSTSIGVSIYPEHGKDTSSLLKYADTSMYLAKTQGVGNYCFFNESMLEGSIERLSLEAKIRTALEDGTFDLVYQPQVDIQSGKVVCTEALTRWQDDGEFISPELFIPVIEELGLMFVFTQSVVKKVCSTIRGSMDAGINTVPVAVNLSPSILVLPNCVDMIVKELDHADLDARYLEVEITESSFLDSTEQVSDNLQRFRDEGIEVALDDFGTGYSCLSYIKDLPISKMKIDGSFVTKIGEDQVSSGIILAIIMMAKTMHLKLVAECVETLEQYLFLKEHDVDVVQGYLLSRPLGLTDLKMLMTDEQGEVHIDNVNMD